MDDRTFSRFAGASGIAFATTCWLAAIVYFGFVPTSQRQPIADLNSFLGSVAQNSTGLYVFIALIALLASFGLVGIVAVFIRVRTTAYAWALVGLVVGTVASVGTLLYCLQLIAQFKYAAAILPFSEELALNAINTPSSVNPFGIITFGMTALWFLVTSALLLKQGFPRLFVYIGLFTVVDLAIGFLSTLSELKEWAILSVEIAGVLLGPVFWFWLGAMLLRGDDVHFPLPSRANTKAEFVD